MSPFGISSGGWANIIAIVVLTAGFVKNCNETETLIHSQSIVNTNQDTAIGKIGGEVEKLRDDKETARELSAMRADIAALNATVNALREDMKRRR